MNSDIFIERACNWVSELKIGYTKQWKFVTYIIHKMGHFIHRIAIYIHNMLYSKSSWSVCVTTMKHSGVKWSVNIES